MRALVCVLVLGEELFNDILHQSLWEKNFKIRWDKPSETER